MIFRVLLFLIMILISNLSWAGDFQALLSSSKGIGTWHEVPFGKMRLLSCSTGVKALTTVVGGLQVQTNAGWTIKKPVLVPTDTTKLSWIETPVVLQNKKDPFYEGDVFFPLIYGRNPLETADFNFGVQGDFTACQKNHCITLPLKLELTLSATEAEYTSACPYIIRQQKKAPLPATILGITGTAKAEDDVISITFSGIKKPKIAFLQSPTLEEFIPLETRLEETGISMRLQTKPWGLNSTKEWILITDKGIFRVPVVMKDKLKELPPASAPWSVWWLGWKFFFLSPLFIWWGLGIKRTNKQWKKQILTLIASLPLVLIGALLFNYSTPFDFSVFYIFLLIFICLFPPQKILWTVCLFIIWPMGITRPQLPLHLTVLWLLIMWIEISLPFVFLYLKTDEIGSVFRQFKKTKFFQFNFIFLLPTLLLLGEIIWQKTRPEISYSDVLNPSGFTVVCKKCDPWRTFSDGHFIRPNSFLGQILTETYNRSEELILWQKRGERFILPPNVSAKEATTFMTYWQRYHVDNTP